MRFRFERRYLQRNGKCIGCGKEVKANKEKITILFPYKSQVYQLTICDDCIKEMNVLIKEEMKYENNK